MEIKRKRYLLSLAFSAFMILMIFAWYKPLEVQAARTMPHKSEGYIYVKKGSASGAAGYYYFRASTDKIQKTGGLSYNKKTNTLTINNFKHEKWWILCRDMGDLKVVAKGTSKLCGIQHFNSLIWTNTLTIDGSGKLVLKGNGYSLYCAGKNAKITIGEKVKIDAKNTGGKSALCVVRNGKLSGSKVFNVKGAHSSGKVKREAITFAHLGSCYRYTWSKNTFTKSGKAGSSGSSSSSSKKPAKMAFSGMGRVSRTTDPNHGIYVKWNKVTKNAKGYQLQISKDSSFKNIYYETNLGTNYDKFSFYCPDGTKLYFRIRAYNTVSGKKVYGAWSATKSATVK